jgi:hypothetical protein
MSFLDDGFLSGADPGLGSAKVSDEELRRLQEAMAKDDLTGRIPSLGLRPQPFVPTYELKSYLRFIPAAVGIAGLALVLFLINRKRA